MPFPAGNTMAPLASEARRITPRQQKTGADSLGLQANVLGEPPPPVDEIPLTTEPLIAGGPLPRRRRSQSPSAQPPRLGALSYYPPPPAGPRTNQPPSATSAVDRGAIMTAGAVTGRLGPGSAAGATGLSPSLLLQATLPDPDTMARWPKSRVVELSTKLQALRYTFPFDVKSADLVERLFSDLLKSVQTSKNLMFEVRNLRENQAAAASRETAGSDGQITLLPRDTWDERATRAHIFRLQRLAESLLYICSNILHIADTDSQWTGASVALLALLLSYENEVDGNNGTEGLPRGMGKGRAMATTTTGGTTTSGVDGGELESGARPRSEFPPFLREFHSVWRIHEERDMLAARLEEKDKQIAVLLMNQSTSGHGPVDGAECQALAGLQIAQERHTIQMLKVVESLRSQVEQRFPAAAGAGSATILDELQRTRAALRSVEGEKTALEDRLLKVEKKLASVLKKQLAAEQQQAAAGNTKDGALQGGPEDPPIPGEGDNAAGNAHPGRVELAPWRQNTGLLFMSDHEFQAFETAQEAWRRERILLENAKQEKEMELSQLRQRVALMENDMEAATKKFSRVVAQLDKANDALVFARNRVEFFEKEEIQRQISVNDHERQLADQREEIHELKKLLTSKELEIAELIRQVDDVGRAVVAQDAQLQGTKKDRDYYQNKLKKMQQEFQSVTQRAEDLEANLHTAVEQQAIAAERLAELERETEARYEVSKRIEQQEEEIGNLRLNLEKQTEAKHQLEGQLLKTANDKATYKQSVQELRGRCQGLQRDLTSLEGRYRALLDEFELRPDPQAEGPLATSLRAPNTAWQARFEDKNEEIRTLRATLETMSKELRAFRKARDSAVIQRQWAVDQLKEATTKHKKLQKELTQTISTCNMLRRRLQSFVTRAEYQDTIIAQQRNHILSHRLELPTLDTDLLSATTPDDPARHPGASNPQPSSSDSQPIRSISGDAGVFLATGDSSSALSLLSRPVSYSQPQSEGSSVDGPRGAAGGAGQGRTFLAIHSAASDLGNSSVALPSVGLGLLAPTTPTSSLPGSSLLPVIDTATESLASRGGEGGQHAVLTSNGLPNSTDDFVFVSESQPRVIDIDDDGDLNRAGGGRRGVQPGNNEEYQFASATSGESGGPADFSADNTSASPPSSLLVPRTVGVEPTPVPHLRVSLRSPPPAGFSLASQPLDNDRNSATPTQSSAVDQHAGSARGVIGGVKPPIKTQLGRANAHRRAFTGALGSGSATTASQQGNRHVQNGKGSHPDARYLIDPAFPSSRDAAQRQRLLEGRPGRSLQGERVHNSQAGNRSRRAHSSTGLSGAPDSFIWLQEQDSTDRPPLSDRTSSYPTAGGALGDDEASAFADATVANRGGPAGGFRRSSERIQNENEQQMSVPDDVSPQADGAAFTRPRPPPPRSWSDEPSIAPTHTTRSLEDSRIEGPAAVIDPRARGSSPLSLRMEDIDAIRGETNRAAEAKAARARNGLLSNGDDIHNRRGFISDRSAPLEDAVDYHLVDYRDHLSDEEEERHRQNRSERSGDDEGDKRQYRGSLEYRSIDLRMVPAARQPRANRETRNDGEAIGDAQTDEAATAGTLFSLDDTSGVGESLGRGQAFGEDDEDPVDGLPDGDSNRLTKVSRLPGQLGSRITGDTSEGQQSRIGQLGDENSMWNLSDTTSNNNTTIQRALSNWDFSDGIDSIGKATYSILAPGTQGLGSSEGTGGEIREGVARQRRFGAGDPLFLGSIQDPRPMARRLSTTPTQSR